MCAMRERDFSFINDALEIDLDNGQITVHVVNDTKEKSNNDKFVPKIENLSNNNLNHNELPSYSSLDFIADEPPKYEVVTGKKLSHGTGIVPEALEHTERPSSFASFVSKRKKILIIASGLLLISLIIIIFSLGIQHFVST
ncbi:uncharacterized protein LOC124814407 isoform X1 [Hydra vulgaris]|uniref:uncharacterized protein LOC124814407 isoform X1 n=1 Tax=Hydra vulgaris TaxID=6087 RepID=UPI00019248E1|nr:uncharacterized protein LOC124814407 [Hydra vulgaris]